MDDALTYRRLTVDDEDAAYAILPRASAWLRGRGIRQWEQPLPRKVYHRRMERGENVALCDATGPVAIASLLHQHETGWAAWVPGAVWWLSTLAVTDAWRGRGVGAELVRRCCADLATRSIEALHLDCAVGPLQAYYARLGFVELARAELIYWNGAFAMALMRRAVP